MLYSTYDQLYSIYDQLYSIYDQQSYDINVNIKYTQYNNRAHKFVLNK